MYSYGINKITWYPFILSILRQLESKVFNPSKAHAFIKCYLTQKDLLDFTSVPYKQLSKIISHPNLTIPKGFEAKGPM